MEKNLTSKSSDQIKNFWMNNRVKGLGLIKIVESKKKRGDVYDFG